MSKLRGLYLPGVGLLMAIMLVTAAAYSPGLSGGWLFDDYPNIVENKSVQPDSATLSSLSKAALSSPSSLFKRPLASLSFAANYLAGGLNPWGWKLVNLIIHLANGLLVFLLARSLIAAVDPALQKGEKTSQAAPQRRYGVAAALIAGAWMLLPINVTAVLYVVQRMESLANLFVLIGLLGYMIARRRMLDGNPGLYQCVVSLTVPTLLGLSAKETAVMLPLYAFLIEWLVFRFQVPLIPTGAMVRDRRLIALFIVVLWLPMLTGLMWLLPGLLKPSAWAARDFTVGTRLLSEARVVVDYIGWTLLPIPQWLSFYHDDFPVSQGLLQPWTTLLSILAIAALLTIAWWQRRRRPLFALGIALYFGCHLLTATILPLELVYEHRNYFASFGLLLAVVPLLIKPGAPPPGTNFAPQLSWSRLPAGNQRSMPLVRRTLFTLLAASWLAMTTFTTYQWGNPLRLAVDLAARAPASPRAQYGLGHTYIVYSGYDPASPFTPRVYAPLERAATLPHASILPEQALIYFNARMHRPLKRTWWQSMIGKLKARKPGAQDISSLGALTHCVIHGDCKLPQDLMVEAFLAALGHPHPDARLLAAYGDYAWNILGDRALGERVTADAAKIKPDEPVYHITLAHMYLVLGHPNKVRRQISELQRLNYGKRLNKDIAELQSLLKKNVSIGDSQ